MQRLAVVMVATAALLAVSSASAWGRTVCVGTDPGCHATIQSALIAADDGDLITVGAGRFRGPITITRSVTLAGAGASSTVIKGGGPVVTIGTFGAASQPAVTIKDLTITGGFTDSAALCGPVCGTDYVEATALGGGIEVPPAADDGPGATVMIIDSVVSGNRVVPRTTVPSVRARCFDAPCRFGLAGGGGIDTWGAMTLVRTTVRGNEVGGPPASDAVGAGILNESGHLRLRRSVVEGNRAIASLPNGRFGEGGGIFMSSGALTIDRSVVRRNHASLTTAFASGVDMNAHGGGIHVGDAGPASIDESRIDQNSVAVNAPAGQPVGFDAGLFVGESTLMLRDSSVSENDVTATVASSEDSGPSGSALEFGGDATIANSRIAGNRSTVTSSTGVAGAVGAVSAFGHGAQPSLIINSVISHNSVRAASETGTATIQGVGITGDGHLRLRNVLISDNHGTASAPAGFARGGGIWNDLLFFEPPVELALENTVVAHNTLNAGVGLSVQGGGIFTAFPVALTKSVIAQNTPDQCFGC